MSELPRTTPEGVDRAKKALQDYVDTGSTRLDPWLVHLILLRVAELEAQARPPMPAWERLEEHSGFAS